MKTTAHFKRTIQAYLEERCNKQILNHHFSVKLNRHMIFETLRL